MSESFIDNYKAKHRHPLNKLTHSIGIPMIVISLPLFFFNWRWALALFIIGWDSSSLLDMRSRATGRRSSNTLSTYWLAHGGSCGAQPQP